MSLKSTQYMTMFTGSPSIQPVYVTFSSNDKDANGLYMLSIPRSKDAVYDWLKKSEAKRFHKCPTIPAPTAYQTLRLVQVISNWHVGELPERALIFHQNHVYFTKKNPPQWTDCTIMGGSKLQRLTVQERVLKGEYWRVPKICILPFTSLELF